MPVPAQGWVCRRLLGLTPEEASFRRRGFPPGKAFKRRSLELIGETFIAGYNAAIAVADVRGLSDELNRVDGERRGFAFEGAAMALALTDSLFGQQRFNAMLSASGARHVYMMYVGLGWAVARLPWKRMNLQRLLRRHDPILGWLIVDGYGFHEGYFHWRSAISRTEVPRGIDRRAGCVFDQGLGRSLWFFGGADPVRVAECIASFPASRQPDLWSGVGLAATYAGSVSHEELVHLLSAAGPFTAHLGQGAAFAATARATAENEVPHTETAVRVLCGQSTKDIVAATHAARAEAGSASPDDRYEAWRSGIRSRLSVTDLLTGRGRAV